MNHIYYPNNAVIPMERSRNLCYFYDTDINCNMAMVLLNIIISMISIIERENTIYCIHLGVMHIIYIHEIIFILKKE